MQQREYKNHFSILLQHNCDSTLNAVAVEWNSGLENHIARNHNEMQMHETRIAYKIEPTNEHV